MYRNVITVLCILFISTTNGVRLHKLFQYLDGFRSDFQLRGFLHLGYDYAVFLRVPKPHDRFLVYELYEAKKIADVDSTKPRILAISKIPVEYVREQLKTFRDELYRAKYVDENVVPGTQVQTLREWQIDKALNFHSKDGMIFNDRAYILRSKV